MKEEKLEEAKRLYESANADQKYVLESLFPELAGSEDEKIRKWLIGYFHQYKEDGMERYANGLKVDDILAWLEKQDKSSDQIHYWTEEEIEPIISDYLRGAEHYGGMIGRLRCLKPKSFEKQGEQKPTLEMKSAEESLDISSKEYNDIVNGCLYGESKPVDARKNLTLDGDLMQADCMIVEQKPTWTKEDEERLSDAIFFVREYQIPTRDKRLLNAAKEAEDWLKSLRPQNRWKPNDEQMADLWNMLCECRPADHQLLQDIYYGLKKLREE